jgi:hypothetical protein
MSKTEETSLEMAVRGPAGPRGTARVQVRVRAAVGGKALMTALLCILFLACLFSESMAAFEGEVGVEGAWTDNLYLTVSSEDDFVTTPFGYVEGPLGENFGLSYGIDGYFYGTNSELDALWQRAGVWHRAGVGGKVGLEAGLGYSGILHVSDSKNLDHHQVGGTVDLDFRPAERLLIAPRVEGIWRIYPNMDDLDYIEAIGSLLANRSFETQTTLRLNGTIYFRRFLQSISETGEIEAIDSQTEGLYLSSAGLSGAANPSGPGAGGGPGNGGERPGRGAGNGMGPGEPGGPPPAVTIPGSLESQSAGQFLIAARLAQSLGSTAGLFVEGTYRTNFLDPPRFAEGTIPGVDREFFDDHYGYEGPGGRMQFSLLLPRGVRMVLSGLIEDRRYVGRDALDLDGNPKGSGGEDRHDKRYEIAIRWEFSRDFDLAFPAGVSAKAGYVRVWNESNDDWFDAGENRFFASASLLW